MFGYELIRIPRVCSESTRIFHIPWINNLKTMMVDFDYTSQPALQGSSCGGLNYQLGNDKGKVAKDGGL